MDAAHQGLESCTDSVYYPVRRTYLYELNEIPFTQKFGHAQICSSYLLVQSGERVCGEWEYWATSRIYDGRLQARAQGERATVELICGRPGGETQTECAYENEAEEAWEKAKGGLAVCEGLLYATQTEMPCSAAKSTGSFFGFNALTNNQRKEILSQPWVKKCLSGER